MPRQIKLNQPDELNDTIIRSIGENYLLSLSSRTTKSVYCVLFHAHSQTKKIARKLLDYQQFSVNKKTLNFRKVTATRD